MTETQPLSASHKRVLAVLFVGVLMGALDIAIVGPALPAIQRSKRSSTAAAGWPSSSEVGQSAFSFDLEVENSSQEFSGPRLGRLGENYLGRGVFHNAPAFEKQ